MTNAPLGQPEPVSHSLASTADLDFLAHARSALHRCVSVSEAKRIRDRADTLGRRVRSAKQGLALANQVAEVRIRAERRAGELLKSMNLHGGDHMTESNGERITLEKLGISRSQSSRWQKLATIPEKTFDQLIQTVRRDKVELTTAAILRLAHSRKRAVVDVEPAAVLRRSSPLAPTRQIVFSTKRRHRRTRESLYVAQRSVVANVGHAGTHETTTHRYKAYETASP